MEGKHAKLSIRDNVGVITINSPNTKVNVLNDDIMEEVKGLMKKFESDENIIAAVLISGKPGCFIAGADITMLEKVKTVEEGIQKSRVGQKLLEDIERSRKPVVAAIQGSCLGGGLEVVLACQYRIAVKDKKTGFGLPEVLLGLLPGIGGTQRLPKLVGVSTSLDMMLTGRTLRADRAKEIGLVDRLVDPVEAETERSSEERTTQHLEETAVKIASELATGVLVPYRAKSFMNIIMEWALMIGYVKDKVFGRARAEVMHKSKGLYPAPLTILHVVRTGLDKGPDAGYDAEAKAFGELAQTPQSHGLISLFHGQTECKKNRFGNPEKNVKNIAVLGSGLMGTAIAQLLAEKSFHVILKSYTEKGLSHGYDAVTKGLEEAKNRNRISPTEHEKIMSNLKFQLNYDNFTNVDIIVESVKEDLNTKQRSFKEVETIIPEDCIFATNTSSFSVAKITTGSKRPDKVVGMHYFSPVGKMQLLEIVTTPQTSKDTVATAVQVGLKQGKVVIVVKDGPGFYTNRILGFVVRELLNLLLEGVDPNELNKLTTTFGFPVGLCTLVDEVGIDVFWNIHNSLVSAFGSRFTALGSDPCLEALMKTGNFGRKTGSGIFVYETRNHEINPDVQCIFTRHKREAKLTLNDEDILMRLVTRFVNEALLCLEEQILPNPLEGDIGAVFGLGFPPFTGGPFHFVDSYGAQRLVDKMRKYEAAYGTCFTPCQLLLDHAQDPSKRFFPKKKYGALYFERSSL